MSVLDLRALLATLNEHGVRYVVIGGVAVGAHGYVRATEDLDIVPEPTAENADRLARALAELEATLPLSGGRPFRAAGDVIAISRGRSLTADTRHGGLDVVQRVLECRPSRSSTARRSTPSCSGFSCAFATSSTSAR